ncbi:hypothetical protein GCM10008090_00120 [Arenicella chitinivorans]|uniref:Uncharacterized protein n=1 Tax=Arenicella chitinivorans TaxID=1329800 RepID=A0A918VH63_9GAMM|nr:hypothetical protein GCM10008090_00120 [Arenicella chitinivorans]
MKTPSYLKGRLRASECSEESPRPQFQPSHNIQTTVDDKMRYIINSVARH